MNDIKEIDNKVRISDSKKERDYVYSISIRMRPKIYDRYNCIVLEILGSQLAFVKTILFENHLKYWGLEIEKEEICKLEGVGQTGGGYVLNDAYRITLKKIPPIRHIE